MEETLKIEMIKECDNETYSELVICKENIDEPKFYEYDVEINVDLNYKEKLNNKIEINLEKDPIKVEPLEVMEEGNNFTCEENIDERKNNKNKHVSQDVTIDIKRYKISHPLVDGMAVEPNEVQGMKRQKQKRSPKPLKIRKSKRLSGSKEVIGKYDTRSYNKQLIANAQFTEDKMNEGHSPNKREVVFENENYIVESLTDSNDTTQTRRINTNRTLMFNEDYFKKQKYICVICDKQFHHKSSLTRHVLKHPKLYKCTACSYKTYHKNHLYLHINENHTKSAVLSCTYCSYKTYHKGHLNIHINAKHTKSVLYNCSYCNFQTYNKGNLNRHNNYKHSVTQKCVN